MRCVRYMQLIMTICCVLALCSFLNAKDLSYAELDSLAMKFYPCEKGNTNESINGLQTMDKAAYRQFLQNECPQAYKQYKQGNNYTIAGWTLFGAGLVGAPISAAYGFVSAYGMSSSPTPPVNVTEIHTTCLCVFAVSGAMLITSIPLLSVGYKFKKKSVDTFNEHCARTPVELSFRTIGSSAEMILNF